MQWTLDHPDQLDQDRRKALQRIREHYGWDQVVLAYDQPFSAPARDEHPRRFRKRP